MKARSLTTRVVLSAVAVAMLAALAGSAAAAFIARSLWRSREARLLHDTVAGMADAIHREARHDPGRLEHGAREAIRESVTVGYRVEVWKDGTLVAASLPGPTVGPFDEKRAAESDAWLIESRRLEAGFSVLVASPKDRGEEMLSIFARSLLLSLPVVLALAVVVGRIVGTRATRPLLEFRDRIRAARPLQALPPAPATGMPAEIVELEGSFRDLWERLHEAVSRELEFAANASHELRTPLTRMRLLAEKLGNATGESAKLVAEVDRMVRLVDSLLILSREVAVGIPSAEAVNVADLVTSGCRRVFAGAPVPEITAPDEAIVRGDGALLEIAVDNLLDNARKFSADGTRPRVVVSAEPERVRLSLTSRGTPTPSDGGDRLFERFYRSPEARAARAGHGLGLPLARHIARLHGGDVRCASTAGEDARFELDLPAWAPAPAREDT
jgi:signal transduction histidine kinase